MHIAQNWRIKNARYAVEGTRCEKCGSVHFPVRMVCPNCEAQPIARYTFDRSAADSVTISEPVQYELRQAAR
jgi:uncharacterized OB-fold protein